MDANHVQKNKNLSNVILEETNVNRIVVPYAGEDTVDYYINDNIIDHENHEIVNKLDLSEEVRWEAIHDHHPNSLQIPHYHQIQQQ